ncbi:MAG: single-stranded DNA-binding protein [Clostridia bacterium]|nr:single-stranded DNA-binding protein [Clostridia bacterium]
MNKSILIGNLTRDPEFSTTNSGVNYCKFTLAVPRKYSNEAGERETDFINIVVWRTQAENCHKYLKKGNKAGVVGSIQTRSYEAQDGTKRYVTEVVAEEVEFLNTRNQNNTGEPTPPPESHRPELQPIEDDSLPF